MQSLSSGSTQDKSHCINGIELAVILLPEVGVREAALTLQSDNTSFRVAA
jgi:hypothetical protein